MRSKRNARRRGLANSSVLRKTQMQMETALISAKSLFMQELAKEFTSLFPPKKGRIKRVGANFQIEEAQIEEASGAKQYAFTPDSIVGRHKVPREGAKVKFFVDDTEEKKQHPHATCIEILPSVGEVTELSLQEGHGVITCRDETCDKPCVFEFDSLIGRHKQPWIGAQVTYFDASKPSIRNRDYNVAKRVEVQPAKGRITKVNANSKTGYVSDDRTKAQYSFSYDSIVGKEHKVLQETAEVHEVRFFVDADTLKATHIKIVPTVAARRKSNMTTSPAQVLLLARVESVL